MSEQLEINEIPKVIIAKADWNGKSLRKNIIWHLSQLRENRENISKAHS